MARTITTPQSSRTECIQPHLVMKILLSNRQARHIEFLGIVEKLKRRAAVKSSNPADLVTCVKRCDEEGLSILTPLMSPIIALTFQN